MNGYKLDTRIVDNAVIDVTLAYDYGCPDIRQEIIRQVCDTREEQVKAALVKLGWTPPKSVRSYTVDELIALAKNEDDSLPWSYTDRCHMCGGVGAFLNWLRERDIVKEGCEK